ncbi:MAG: hypothetical protein HMLIMOIP_000658 [Candidatus Nitrosomirales archaeon]|jgi:hypothetical protein
MRQRNKLTMVIALAALASLALFIAINVLVPRYSFDFPRGGGICFHKQATSEIINNGISINQRI